MVKQHEHPGQPGHDPFEDRVREALHTEADTVEPSGHGLRAIQARTARGATRRAGVRWFAGGGAVLATAAAVTAVVMVGSTDLGLGGDDAAPAAPPVASQPLQVFYLDSTPESLGEPGSVRQDAPGLYSETHPVVVNGDPVEAAVRELVGSTPTDPDYANPWNGITVRSVRPGQNLVVVDVSALPASGSVRASALQALAHTVQAAQGGNPTVEVQVDGTVATRADAADPVGTFAGIWVSTPTQGATVGSPVRFTGRAATFEGNVAYEIRRGQRVVARGATIAGGVGVWSPWSFRQRLQPGAYTVVAFDEDPALGGRRDIDTKAFTVR